MAKKILALLAALSLLFGAVPALAESEPATVEAEVLPEELTVAVTTPLTGSFFTSLWGNGSSDMDVRFLLHGYNLVEWNGAQGMFVVNPQVVNSIVVTQDVKTGDRTYTMVLEHDLFYSDGTPITAWDYAFSLLLTMAPEMEAIGGNVRKPAYLLGYDDYISGKAGMLSGVRVIAEDQLAVTVRKEYLPFFYELGLLDCVPYPIHVLAPGACVADDGKGVYLTGEFTADGLAERILNSENGYRTWPSVVSGPYVLVSFEDGTATFELNPYSKVRPDFPRIVFRSLKQDELLPAFTSGEVLLLNKISDAAVVREGMALAEEQPERYTAYTYPRSGLSMLSFNAEHEALADVRVRRAIALLIDRDRFVADTVGEGGQRVDGYYGLGQWMYHLLTGAVSLTEPDAEDAEAVAKYEQNKAALETLSLDSLPPYTRDPAAAAALLDEAGWNLNESGEPWQAGDGLRYRAAEGGPEPLTLHLVYPLNSLAGPALEQQLPADLADGGIGLTVEAQPLVEILPQYYHTEESDYDLFFMATNFDLVYDPSAGFITDGEGNHIWAVGGLKDEKLYEAAVAMRKTQPGDLIGYCRAWLAFQQEYAAVLPSVSLYSNLYNDFGVSCLQNYVPASNVSWTEAIFNASFGTPGAQNAE